MKKALSIILSILVLLTISPLNAITAKTTEYDEEIIMTLDSVKVGDSISDFKLSGYDSDVLEAELKVTAYNQETESMDEVNTIDSAGFYWLYINLYTKDGYSFKASEDGNYYEQDVVVNGVNSNYYYLLDVDESGNKELQIVYRLVVENDTAQAIDNITFESAVTSFVEDGDDKFLIGEVKAQDGSNFTVVDTQIYQESLGNPRAYVILRPKDGYYFKTDNIDGIENVSIFSFGSNYLNADSITGITSEAIDTYVVDETGKQLYSWRLYDGEEIEVNDLLIIYDVTKQEQDRYSEDIELTIPEDLYVGMTNRDFSITGYDESLMDIEYSVINEDGFKDGVFYDEGNSIEIILSMKDSKTNHFDKDEDYFYSGSVKVNGQEVDEKIVCHTFVEEDAKGYYRGESCGRDLLITIAVEPKAYDYSLYMHDGTLFTDANYENEYNLNTDTWSVDGNKLYLNGFVFETTANKALVLEEDTEIVQTNSLTNYITVSSQEDAIAIECDGDLTISGDGYSEITVNRKTEKSGTAIKANSLTVSDYFTIDSYGVGLDIKNDINLNNVSLTVGGVNNAIACNGIITVNDGDITAYSGMGIGIKGAKKLVLNNGNVYVSANKEGIDVLDELVMNGETKLNIDSYSSYALALKKMPAYFVLAAKTYEDSFVYGKYIPSGDLFYPATNGTIAAKAHISSKQLVRDEVIGNSEFVKGKSEDIKWHIIGLELDDIYDEDWDDSNGYSGLQLKCNDVTLEYGKDYTLSQGSIIIDINCSCLNSLNVGNNKLSVHIDVFYETYDLNTNLYVQSETVTNETPIYQVVNTFCK